LFKGLPIPFNNEFSGLPIPFANPLVFTAAAGDAFNFIPQNCASQKI